MKRTLFGLLALSMSVLMSCGGGGGAPTTHSAVGATAVTSAIIGTGNPLLLSVNETCDGTDVPITGDTLACGTGTGSMTVSGTTNCTESSYKYNIKEVFSSDCTWNISTCDMGNTTMTGTVNIGLDVSTQDYISGSFSFTIKSTDLTLSYKAVAAKACPIDLTFKYSPSIDWSSETSIYEAFTGTICGADWTETQKTINDPTNLEKLCTVI